MANSKINLEKLNLYISTTDKTLPILDSDQKSKKEDFAAEIRFFFTDDDLLISYEETSVLHQTYFIEKISEIYNDFLAECSKNKNKIQFIQFVEYWVASDDKLSVSYEPYDKMIKQRDNKTLEPNFSGKIPENQNDQINFPEKNEKQNNINLDFNMNLYDVQECFKKDINNYQNNKFLLLVSQKTNSNPQNNLKFIHGHYCRKFIALPKNQSFEDLQNYYKTMNLTQWILFVKQMNLLNLKLQKQHKKNDQVENINGNSEKTEQKEHKKGKKKACEQIKMDSHFYKKIFQKFSQQYVLNFTNFVCAVKQVLMISFGITDFQKDGYQKLGLNDQKTFKNLLQKIGEYMPQNCYVFKNIRKDEKSEIKKILLSRIQNKLVQDIQKKPKPVYFDKKISEHIGLKESKNITTVNKKIYRSRQERYNHQLLGKMSLKNLRKLKVNKQIQAQLHEIIGNGQMKQNDYSSFRLKSNELKERGSANKTKIQQKNSNKGIIKRIDKRIDKIINKNR